MKKLLVSDKPIWTDEGIFGMSRIGFLNKSGNPKERSSIYLYIHTDDPGKIPHFHIYIQDENDACIMFEKSEYFSHGSNNNHVSTQIAKQIDKLLRMPYKGDTTYWRYSIELWNNNNSDILLPEDLEQPDYSELNTYDK